MKKRLIFIITLATILTVSGTFAVFSYGQNEPDSKSGIVDKDINEEGYIYGPWPTYFTRDLQKIAQDACSNDPNDEAYKYGLNGDYNYGMNKTLLYSQFSRINYKYVGSMDSSYGNDVYGNSTSRHISIILCFPKVIENKTTLYMYLVKKSNDELKQYNVGDILEKVYRVAYTGYPDPEQNNKTIWGFQECQLGKSRLEKYEPANGETKTFGYHSSGELWEPLNKTH